MCGIMGYVGRLNARDVIIEGLKVLEYRGYDSAGMWIYGDNGTVIIKRKGEIKELEESSKEISGYIGIGHTRWATHGKADEVNAHPHTSPDGFCTLVHNGIIENCQQLKKKFGLKGLKSETDSEIAAAVFAKFKNLEPKTRIQAATSLFSGSFAFLIVFEDCPETIFAVKRKSPLVLAENDSEVFMSSDAIALSRYADSFYILKEKEIAKITKSGLTVYGSSGIVVKKKKHKAANEQEVDLKNFDCIMEKEIAEIPTALKNTAKNMLEIDGKVGGAEKNLTDKIDKILLVGCGTAYHACKAGKIFFEQKLGIFTVAVNAGEFRYSSLPIDTKTLCIFVSQSGETADTLACVQIALKKKAKVLALTNVQTSSITNYANCVCTSAGPERAVASTKAYSCQVLAFYLLSEFFADSCGKYNKIVEKTAKKCEKDAKMMLKTDIFKFKDLFINFKKIFFIGRGIDYVTAKESSLKFKEITYKSSIDIEAGELKHGTLALIDEDSLVTVFMTDKKLKSKTLNAVAEIRARGGCVFLITPYTDGDSDFCLKIPDYFLHPAIDIIFSQKIACEVSKALGNNPDKPRNLAKSVTVE